MTVYFNKTFVNTNFTGISVHDASWVRTQSSTHTGNARIESNRLLNDANSPAGSYLNTTAIGSANYKVTASLIKVAPFAGYSFALYIRGSGTTTYSGYRAIIDSNTGVVTIASVAGGTVTALNTGTAAAIANGATVTYEFKAVGDVLTVSVNGTIVVTTTNSTYASAGSAGLFTNSTNAAGFAVVSIAAEDVASTSPPSGTVTIISVAPGETTASVVYSYDAADQTGFEYRLDGGTPAALGATPATITGLAASTTYGIEARPVNAFGSGAWSTLTTFTTNAAAVPPTVAISNQTIAGQNLTLDGTYTETLTSAFAFLPAATIPNGAVDVGPVALTYGGGVWSVSFPGLVPGDYDPPEIMVNNGAGSDTEFGSAFTVMEIDGEPEAPDPGNTEEVGAVADTVDGEVDLILGEIEETGTTVETLGATAEQVGATAEAGVATDVSQQTSSSSGAQQEFAAPTEVITGALVSSPALVEAAPATDSQSSAAAQLGAQAETGVAAETLGGVVDEGGVEVQDMVAPAEAQGASAGAVRDTPEALAASEAAGCVLGVRTAVAETGAAADSISGLTVFGTVTVEALASLAHTQNAVVGRIQGDMEEVLVLTEQQFQSVLLERGVLDVEVVDDATFSFPIITPTTVVEQLNLADIVARLAYARPPSAGSTQTRRFIVYYK